MNKRIDTHALLATLDVVEVVGRYIDLQKDGAEYAACCPFHNEGTPSFKVSPSKQFYHCFGCGANGDAIKFVREYRQIGFLDAVNEITGGHPPEEYQPPKRVEAKEREKAEAADDWQPIVPVPEDAPPPPRTYSKKIEGKWVPLEFVQHWPYHDQTGALLGYVARFLLPNGKKDVMPQTYCRNPGTGRQEWRYLSFPKPRPLYGLRELAGAPGAIVLLVEGEKTADAARRLLSSVPGVVVVSWPGGGKAIRHVDWSPLAGRQVLLWPDADEPGLNTMVGWFDSAGRHNRGVADYLKEHGCTVRVIAAPAGQPDGWDLADGEAEGWTGDAVLAHVRATASEPPDLLASRQHDEPPPITDVPPRGDDGGHDDEEPFRPLGYDHGVFYYLAGASAQVVDLTASQHTKLNLITLAPLVYWQNRFPAKGGVEWDMAANALMRRCEAAGVYDAKKIRGRGAWWDDNRAVLHVGDRLIVDGCEARLTDADVRYIYEAAPPLNIDLENPLSARDAHEFVQVCRMLQWEKPINAMLFAGWVFLAPVCGGLWWRPHAWVTGGAGTGKSWLLSHIVRPCVGSYAIYPQSTTTEAAIRQTLNCDARPVVFDEAEGEDQQAQQRIQAIMGLMRQASSENDGEIMKGSATGRATAYRIRSMFMFASIGIGVQQYADKTRVTLLQLAVDLRKTAEQRQQQFRELEARSAELLTPEYCARLRARAVSMIGVIRENAKTFAAAGAAVIGTQRLGDQIGTMLAGAYALHSNGLVTLEKAREWIDAQDWTEETALHEVKDEHNCLSHILEHTIRLNGQRSQVERNVGELIMVSAYRKNDSDCDAAAARDALLRIGVKVDQNEVVISNQHSYLRNMLKGTLWAQNWGGILKRVQGAEATKPIRFGASGTHRGVRIPLSVVCE